MLNKVSAFLREQEMLTEGDSIVCAVSGGADSVALLFALYLLREKLHIFLSAAHFNHHLRGEESDRDEAFVRAFCDRYDIPLTVGGGEIVPGSKGLEAAARDARYAFLRSLPGKIATAHTADDNAETVLMHLLRGTGLKGLGGITPVNGRIIRPMLTVTRREVEAFLSEYFLSHIEDSSNTGDAFLRNRIRHSVVPLMTAENPSFARSVSAMALRLRQDEDYFASQMTAQMPGAAELRQMHPALRSRYLERFLKDSGVPEPEQAHLQTLEKLVFSEKPSARADFPGGVVIGRSYDDLVVIPSDAAPEEEKLNCPGVTELPNWGLRVTCTPADKPGEDGILVCPQGALRIRSRCAGDSLRLPGGTKQLKKLMIDRKIPAVSRNRIPVLADDAGVISAVGIGNNLDRITDGLPAMRICIVKTENTVEVCSHGK